jgi:hypothetical protein
LTFAKNPQGKKATRSWLYPKNFIRKPPDHSASVTHANAFSSVTEKQLSKFPSEYIVTFTSFSPSEYPTGTLCFTDCPIS